MQIDCPACAAGYEVPDALLAGRRPVRCARCGHQWIPQAPPPPISLRADAGADGGADGGGTDAERASMDAPARPLVPSAPQPVGPLAPRLAGSGLAAAPTFRALRLAWAGSLLLVAAAVALLLVYHRPIARAWPPSLRVYGALGLVHKPR